MSSEQVREASPPPLLAYTASHQQSMKGKGKGKMTKKNTSKKHSTSIPIHKRKRATEPVLFDEKARREFLTGFHKRKQARIETGKKKAIEREKEERRQMRAETRKARKEQAAENVRMEKIAYGGEDESDEDNEGGEVEDVAREHSPSAYETEEHHTTVTVQEWNPEEEEANAEAKAKEKAALLFKKQQAALPPSSRRMAKKLKNATQQQEKSSNTQRNNKIKNLADAKAISKLMDPEELPIDAIPEEVLNPTNKKTEEEDEAEAKKKKSPKFYYESKLERAKAKAKIRETKQKFAEKRKLQRLEANKINGKQRMRKSSNKGKGKK